MLGLKSFASASITIRGVELMHRIRKGQFDLQDLATQGKLRPKSGQLFLLLEPSRRRSMFACLYPWFAPEPSYAGVEVRESSRGSYTPSQTFSFKFFVYHFSKISAAIGRPNKYPCNSSAPNSVNNVAVS
jgi:hypothetical protein